MLDALVDEADLPASELARRVGVSPSTASAHLTRLVEARLAIVERHSRQRRYRLTGPAVAEAPEALAAIAPLRPCARSARLHAASCCATACAPASASTCSEA